jgi:hypothetical protein
MQAITVSDREAGVAGLSLTDLPYPVVSENDKGRPAIGRARRQDLRRG